MFLGLLKCITIFYYWTWFIWPFAFIGLTFHCIKIIVTKDYGLVKFALMDAISLLIILAGILGSIIWK